MKRRPDIQGLRAVAILFVVLFHARLSFKGGFTGVDVFFVISGFVIAGTLLGELTKTGRLNLGGFFARRARRILPAPAVMLVFVALAGILADPAGTQHMSAMTGITASALFSNFYLYTLPTGYFDVSTQLNPLLHTWMLSVIAQIYVVFPLLLLAAWWLGRSRLGRGRSREFVWAPSRSARRLSFLLSYAITHGWLHGSPATPSSPSTPRRLVSGSSGGRPADARAATHRAHPRLAGERARPGRGGRAGLLRLLHRAGELPRDLGAAAGRGRLAAHRRRGRDTARLLASAKPSSRGLDGRHLLQRLPLALALHRLCQGALADPGRWLVAVAAAVSLLPAWLSYRYVENTIRLRSGSGARPRVAGRAATAIASACIAVPIVANLGLIGAQHFIDQTKALKSWRHTTALPSSVGRGCESSKPYGPGYDPRCTWHVAHPRGTIVLFGDSNAGMYTEPVVKAGNSAGYDVTVATASSCPYVGLRITRVNGEEHNCPGFGSKSIAYMVKVKPSLVVLVARTDFYLQNPDDGLAVVGKGGFTFSNEGKARLYRQALHAQLERLSAAGVPALVVHPIPVLPIDQATCAIVRVLLGACSSSLPRSSVDDWLRLAIQTEDAGAAGVKLVKTLNFENELCGKTRCSTVKNGVSLYRDSRHLSVDGALTLTPEFEKAFRAHAVPRK